MRVAVVDIGSNSVRLVVFDGAARAPAYFFNEKVLCGLGEGLGKSGYLSPKGAKRALDTLSRFAKLGENMGVLPLRTVATAAVRDAKDGPDFLKEIQRKTGLDPQILTGEEEARLAASGVLLGNPQASGLVCDIGGSSMELAQLDAGQIGMCQTSPLGPLRLADLSPKARRKYIKTALVQFREQFAAQPSQLHLVGGSWRAIAQVDMIRNDYPLSLLQAYVPLVAQLKKTAQFVAESTPEKLATLSRSSKARQALMPHAAEVLVELIRQFEPREISISAYGLREGLLFEAMPVSERKLDPLIEAARYEEFHQARFPGFGDTLYSWMRPLFDELSAAKLRLVRAACLLHDVSWRAHPDYRSQICFEHATRANFGYLAHEDRVFIGLALFYRYKQGVMMGAARPAAIGLLNEADMVLAQTLGKAMRLGALLGTGTKDVAATAPLRIDGDRLELCLNQAAADLQGETLFKRLQSLADNMKLTPHIQL